MCIARSLVVQGQHAVFPEWEMGRRPQEEGRRSKILEGPLGNENRRWHPHKFWRVLQRRQPFALRHHSDVHIALPMEQRTGMRCLRHQWSIRLLILLLQAIRLAVELPPGQLAS